MSTARNTRVHFKEDTHPSAQDSPNHAFRRALWISLAAAALILWQLNSIIHALGSIQIGLTHLEGLRNTLGGIIRVSYSEVTALVGPIIHHIVH